MQAKEARLFTIVKYASDSDGDEGAEVAWGVEWPDGKVSVRLGSPYGTGKFNETLELSSFVGLTRLLSHSGNLAWRSKLVWRSK